MRFIIDLEFVRFGNKIWIGLFIEKSFYLFKFEIHIRVEE